MTKRNFKIDIYTEDNDILTDVDLREELKRRLNLNIIDGEIYDRVIYALENGLSVSNIFAENGDVIKACNVAQENFLQKELDKRFHNDTCTVKTAKLLNELGIQLSCEKYWCNYYTGEPINKWKLLPKNKLSFNFMEFRAPNLETIKAWLAGNKDINIYCYQPNETGYWAHSLEKKAKYNSYKEALEIGIIEALEYIQISPNKN